MMRASVTSVLVLGAALGSCSQQPAADANEEIAQSILVTNPEGLEPGSNEMLRSALSGAPELEVLISDVIIPAGAEVPRHYHPGEEFVYVIEGSAMHVEEGQPDRKLKAGDAMVIAPEAVHSPRGGPDGARAIVFRVHVRDQPERIPVPLEE